MPEQHEIVLRVAGLFVQVERRKTRLTDANEQVTKTSSPVLSLSNSSPKSDLCY